MTTDLETLKRLATTETKPIPPERLSTPGTEWVCGACGRHAPGDRYDLGDESCVMWASLCSVDSFVFGSDGRLIDATAVKESA